MGKRHEAIGIKQAIRFEWMQKAANLLLAGLDAKTIRQELHELISNKKGSGAEGKRGETSRTQVVNILMKIWVSPNADLITFRDSSLSLLRKHPTISLSLHWGMISAAYPFWFNVARQVGRLFSLQEQITQSQIFTRLKEQYGDRETVSRFGRYAIRSFVYWGVLKNSETKGCYHQTPPVPILDPELSVLLIESALHANPEAKGNLRSMLNNPAFFPFQLQSVTGDLISRSSNRIDLIRHGLDDELLKMK